MDADLDSLKAANDELRAEIYNLMEGALYFQPLELYIRRFEVAAAAYDFKLRTLLTTIDTARHRLDHDELTPFQRRRYQQMITSCCKAALREGVTYRQTLKWIAGSVNVGGSRQKQGPFH